MTIEEVCKLRKEGAFRRDIVERKAESIRFDTATMSCGHTAALPAWDNTRQQDCRTCMEEALKAPSAGNGAKAGGGEKK